MKGKKEMKTIIAEFKPDWANRAVKTARTGVSAPEDATCGRCDKPIKGRAVIIGYELYVHWACNKKNLAAIRRANR